MLSLFTDGKIAGRQVILMSSNRKVLLWVGYRKMPSKHRGSERAPALELELELYAGERTG
jgi:hypothetical protein